MIEKGHINLGLIVSVTLGILVAVLIIRLINARDAKTMSAPKSAPIGFAGGGRDEKPDDPDTD